MDLTALDLLIVGVMTGWLGLTIVRQISPQRFPSLWKYDLCSLVPRWSFFTPRPVYFDYGVFVRDQLGDGTILPWQAPTFLRGGEWRWREGIWDPLRRSSKVLSFFARHLARSQARKDRASLESDPYYCALERALMGLPRKGSAVSRQFIVVQSFGFIPQQPTRVILVSEFQPLAPWQ